MPLQPPRATPSVRRRSPAAVVLGGALVLASAVLVAGGAFVAGFGSLLAGGALLVRPARERRRRSGERRTPFMSAGRVAWRGTVRTVKLSRTLVVVRLAPAARASAHGTAVAAAASARALVAASGRAADFGATAGYACRRAGGRAWRAAVELRDRVADAWAERRQRAWSWLRPALRAGKQKAQSAVRATVPVVRSWTRRAIDAAKAAGRRAGVIAGRTRRSLHRAALSEAAHLGIVTMPPAPNRPGEQGWGRDAEPPAGGQAAPEFSVSDSAEGEAAVPREPAAASFRGGVVPDAADEPPETAEARRAANAPADDAAAAPEPAAPRGHEDSGAPVATSEGASKSKSVESAPPTPQRPRRAAKRTPRTTTPKGGRAPHESR